MRLYATCSIQYILRNHYICKTNNKDMPEQYFEEVKENFNFESDSQYSSFCQMYQEWQYQQLMEEINKD